MPKQRYRTRSSIDSGVPLTPADRIRGRQGRSRSITISEAAFSGDKRDHDVLPLPFHFHKNRQLLLGVRGCQSLREVRRRRIQMLALDRPCDIFQCEILEPDIQTFPSELNLVFSARSSKEVRRPPGKCNAAHTRRPCLGQGYSATARPHSIVEAHSPMRLRPHG